MDNHYFERDSSRNQRKLKPDLRRILVVITTLIVIASIVIPAGASKKKKANLYSDYDYEGIEEPDGVEDGGGEECKVYVDVGKDGGDITSPGYPESYPSNANCTWNLASPEDTTIKVLITDLMMEESPNCSYDYLEIYNGPDTSGVRLGRFCGRQAERVIISDVNELLIVFVSDSMYEEQGFRLEYLQESPNECNTTLTGNEGTVMSPGYPANYPDNTDCWTTIKGPSVKDKILMSFRTLMVEEDPNCAFDYVEIYDGVSREAPLIGKYCRSSTLEPIISTGDSVLVHFHSDHLLSSKGFLLSYDSDHFEPTPNPMEEIGACTWIMSPMNGTLTSPNYPNLYDKNQICEFFLTAPDNHVLQLTIERIETEAAEDCSFDHLEVRDSDSEGNVLGRFCGITMPGTTVYSHSNSMYIRFQSDDEEEFPGFRAHYQVIRKDSVPHEDVKPPICRQDCVVVPKEVVATAIPVDGTIEKGHRHFLHCASNNSKDEIIWFKDHRRLQPEEMLPKLNIFANNTLMIVSMQWYLEGVYTCIIIGDGGVVIANATLRMTESEKPCNIAFEHTPQNITIFEGGYAFLPCYAKNTDISWMKSGQPLLPTVIAHGNKSTADSTNDISGNHHPRIAYVMDGCLLLNHAQDEDSGLYTCIAKHKVSGCTMSLDIPIVVAPKPDDNSICGQPRLAEPSITKPGMKKGKIVGGKSAQIGSSPWQAMLLEGRKGMFCGGNLVNREWIVTAAHCIAMFPKFFGYSITVENLIIKLGKHSQNKMEYHEQVFTTSKIILHEDYSHDTYDNDIALVRLSKQAVYTDHVLPICLGDPQFLETHVNAQLITGTVSGWGDIKESGGRPVNLQEIRLPIVDGQTCIASSPNFKVTANMFCAGYSQAEMGDSCKGDSGGPFAVKLGERWYLVGLVSWGEGCDAEGKYGFYTKMSKYYDWIQNKFNTYSNKI